MPLIEAGAVGNGFTVTVALPVTGYEVPPEYTDVSVYTAVTVGDTVTEAVPVPVEPLSVTLSVAPRPPSQ